MITDVLPIGLCLLNYQYFESKMKYLFKKLMNLSLGRLIIMGSNESKK